MEVNLDLPDSWPLVRDALPIQKTKGQLSVKTGDLLWL